MIKYCDNSASYTHWIKLVAKHVISTSLITPAGYLVALCILSLLLYSKVTQADQSVVQSNAINSYSFSFVPSTKIIKDSTNTLTLNDVIERMKNVEWKNQDTINEGFSSATYWIQTDISNLLSSPTGLFVEIGYPLLDNIEVTAIDTASGDIVSTYALGDHLPYSHRPIKYPNFLLPLTIGGHESISVYIKVKSTSSIQIPLRVWSENELFVNIKNNAIYSAAMFGAILIMAIYNLFLSFSLKRISYFYFAITLAAYSLVEGTLTGYNYEILWPNAIAWNDISLCVIAGASLTTFTLFSRSFLQLKQIAPRLDFLLLLLACINILISLLSFVIDYKTMILACAVSVIITPLASFFISIYLNANSMVNARYFVVAFTLFVTFSFTFVLGKFGFIERSFFIDNIIHFGALLSIVLLSFALADRINSETREKEIAQAEAIINLNQYRYMYENALEGLFQANRKGELISFNKAFKRLVNDDNLAKSFRFTDFFVDTENNLPTWEKIWQKHVIRGLEVQCKKPDGTLFWALIDAQKMKDKNNNTIIDASLVDITEKKESQKKLSYLASHDSLTGLYNRYEFERFVNHSIAIAKKHNQQNVLLYVDLDQFKIVNDTCGHNAGDELLKQISQLLQSTISVDDILARIGGDEFGIVLNGCQISDAKVVANRILHSLNEYRFSHNEQFFTIGASIGAVLIDTHTNDYQDVITLADAACYAAKEGGRNQIVVHNKGDIVSDRLNEMQLVSSLNQSLEANNFVLFRQNIKSMKNESEGFHYEILLKMQVDGKLLDPGYFIPAMERFNQMKAVDYWVIEKYFLWLSENPDHVKNLELGCINISSQTLEDSIFETFLTSKLEKYSVPPNKICFEIVESSAIINLTSTQQFINKMRAYGVKFALDDFGTGFSSYSYLKSLNIDFLKIDGSFIRDIVKDEVDLAMVRSMTDIAHTMGLKVVAEFVESQEISDCLSQLGVDYGQGFYFDEPHKL